MTMSNVTTSGQVNIWTTEVGMVSLETRVMFILISRRILIPVLTILGTAGNSLSIIILFKHGLHKSSNIILFVLAVNDMTTILLSYNSYLPNIIQSGQSVARVLFTFWQMFRVFGMAAEYTSLCIPSVITIERLIAVFFPLGFHRIVTPFRTWLILAIIYALWFAKFLHSSFFFFYLDFSYYPAFNRTFAAFRNTQHYIENYDFHSKMNHVVIILGSSVPSVLTAVGCFVISVKLRVNANRRRKMTSSAKVRSRAQTTKTLLAVCFVYLVICSYKGILNIPQIEEIVLKFGETFTNVGWVVYEVLALLSYFNNSFNFVVYVALNKKFRNTFLSLFPGPCVSGPDSGDENAPEQRTKPDMA